MQIRTACVGLLTLTILMANCSRAAEPQPAPSPTRSAGVATQPVAATPTAGSVLPTPTATSRHVQFPLARQTEGASLVPCTTPSAVTPDEDDPYSYIGYRTYGYGIAAERGGGPISGVMYPLQELWIAELRSSPIFGLSILPRDEQYWIYTERFLCRDQLERWTYKEVVDVMVVEDDLGEGEGFARHCYFQEERDHFVFAVVTDYDTKRAGELYPEIKRAWCIDQSEGTIQEISTEGITCTAD